MVANNSAILMDIGQGLSMVLGLPRLTSWSTGKRPKKAKSGTFGFNTETKRLEYFDGSYWFAADMSNE